MKAPTTDILSLGKASVGLDLARKFNFGLDFGEYLRLRDVREGHIRLYTAVDQCSMGDMMLLLDEMQRQGTKEITVHICSEGGGVNEALAIYDALRALKVKTIGIAEGLAASAAAMVVLQGVDVRKTLPNTRFLLHEVSQFNFGRTKSSDAKDEAKELEALTDILCTILAERTGHPAEDVKKFVLRHERWLSAEEAKAWNLVDEVVK